ncbi:MAG: hypothetical protein WA783_19745, partial [Phormidesmis sp.]
DVPSAIAGAFQLPESPQTISPIFSSVRSQENSAIDLSSTNEEINLLRDLSPSPRSVPRSVPRSPRSVPRSVSRSVAPSDSDVIPESVSHLAASLEGDRAKDETVIRRAKRDSPSFEPSLFNQIRHHLAHTLASRSNPKVVWTAAAGAIATIILIWAGIASNRSEPSTSTSSPVRTHRVSQS